MGLSDKVIVVTGAAQGIGAEYAAHLGRLGARVILADIDEPGAIGKARELEREGVSAWAKGVDITSESSAAQLVESVVEREGRLDVLVNNAAIYRGMKLAPDILDIDVAYWRKVLDVNVTGTFIMSKAVVPQMRRQRSGKIINQASTAAYVAAPISLHYCTSKAAVITLTKGFAQALGPDGIHVNAIAPGMTTTDATNELFDSERQRQYAQRAALRRTATPQDMAKVVGFLAGPDSDYMTGQTLVVDGGVYFVG